MTRLVPVMFYTAMADDNTEAWAGIYHGLRNEAKQSKRKNAEGVKRVVQAMRDKKRERYSIYPPGWDGREWGE